MERFERRSAEGRTVEAVLGFGSDGDRAQVLREFRRSASISALTPGASFRGLHDSPVNHPATRGSGMLRASTRRIRRYVCVAGAARVTNRAVAVALARQSYSCQAAGKQRRTMAIFSVRAYRIPILMVAAWGRIDAVKRRPGGGLGSTSSRDPGPRSSGDYIQVGRRPGSRRWRALESRSRAARTAPR